MEICIVDIKFECFYLTQNKLLLKANGEHSSSQITIPQIGEYIHHNYQELIENIVASEDELLIYIKTNHQETILEKLNKIPNISLNSTGEIFEVEVCFELGMDWEQMTLMTRKSKEEIIGLILGSNYPLINFGFQPGFMYLDSLSDQLHCDRRSKPRLRVPKGSVAVGGKYIGIYGSESPGGWNIIGRCSHFMDSNGEFNKLPSIRQEIGFKRIDQENYLRKYGNE